MFLWVSLEAVFRGCSVKNVFLEIVQNSQENACARVTFLIIDAEIVKKQYTLFL